MAAPLSGLRFDFDRDSFASKVRGELSEAAADDCDCCHAVANRCDADHRSTKWLRRASGVFAKDDAVECRETQSRLRLRAKEFAAPSAAFIEGCSTARVGVPRKHGQILGIEVDDALAIAEIWHETVIAVQPPHVCCRSQSGKHVLEYFAF
jgi:hypothetical protein